MRDLLAALNSGIRVRSASKKERPDTATRLVLFGTPLVISIALFIANFNLNHPDQLLAGVSLLLGALLTGFAQTASWRERILTRGRPVDGVDVRALNEAGALILVATLMSLVAAAAVVALSNLPSSHDSTVFLWTDRTLSAFAVGSFTYIGISIVIVVNLMWDAFTNEEREAKREALTEFDEPDN